MVAIRIIVRRPLPGVRVALQRGKADLVAVGTTTNNDVVLHAEAIVRPSESPELAGPLIQGPPGARFIYVNWGRRAGDDVSCWDWRAKVPLSGIGPDVLAAGASGAILTAEIEGVARDGGPCCASVPLLAGWHAEPR